MGIFAHHQYVKLVGHCGYCPLEIVDYLYSCLQLHMAGEKENAGGTDLDLSRSGYMQLQTAISVHFTFKVKGIPSRSQHKGAVGVRACAQSHGRHALRVQLPDHRPETVALPPVASILHPCGKR